MPLSALVLEVLGTWPPGQRPALLDVASDGTTLTIPVRMNEVRAEDAAAEIVDFVDGTAAVVLAPPTRRTWKLTVGPWPKEIAQSWLADVKQSPRRTMDGAILGGPKTVAVRTTGTIDERLTSVGYLWQFDIELVEL